ncbi:HAMP domain-containing sensor histidine kinase [Tunturibacter empetritectus]|uniref:histidine kinase n=1 Tax=Tunturiibacter empetritectus TaxID=3069691 RepID=A0AAU7ZG95_9BACT
MQSSTASGPESYSGKFAALRHVTRQMGLGGLAMPTVRKTVDAPAAAEVAAIAGVAIAGVAEGAGLAHDAGNLLGALSLYSDLLALPGVLHDEHKEYANELRMLSDRSWAMIDRLVNHARAGRATKGLGEFAVLPDVVDRCRGLLSRVAGRTVEISYGVGAFQAVKVPVESVERILTNLVKNAAEATPWVGAISIHVEGVLQEGENEGEEPRRRVVMTVSDRGCGMDKAAVLRLMQAGGISSANGRGLGFRVVRELVAIAGGVVSIDSQPEVGTSISVEWSAMKRLDAVVEQERFEIEEFEMTEKRMNDSTVKMVVRGEAGWIAC